MSFEGGVGVVIDDKWLHFVSHLVTSVTLATHAYVYPVRCMQWFKFFHTHTTLWARGRLTNCITISSPSSLDHRDKKTCVLVGSCLSDKLLCYCISILYLPWLFILIYSLTNFFWMIARYIQEDH